MHFYGLVNDRKINPVVNSELPSTDFGIEKNLVDLKTLTKFFNI